MKVLQTTMIAGVVFFVSTGISFAADMDDLDVTIRMVESSDVHEMENELSLPESASDTAREHAESEDGRGLTQANESRDREHDGESSARDGGHEEGDQVHDDREDQADHRDETRDAHDVAHEEFDDVREEEQHEQEQEQEQQETQNDQPDSTDGVENPNDGSMQ